MLCFSLNLWFLQVVCRRDLVFGILYQILQVARLIVCSCLWWKVGQQKTLTKLVFNSCCLEAELICIFVIHHALFLFPEDEPCNFHPYAKKAPLEPVKIERVESCNSFDYDEEEEDSSRERRRPGGYVLICMKSIRQFLKLVTPHVWLRLSKSCDN